MPIRQSNNFLFGTKAETLLRIKPLISTASIPEFFFFSTAEWNGAKKEILTTIHEKFGSALLAIRSSALAEDGSKSSMAGAFLSLLDVDGGKFDAVEDAINRVIYSMTGNPRDQVLVQTMIKDVDSSGVIMTFDMVHGAPYYCVDFDDESGRTDVVTGGVSGHKSLFVYRHADHAMIKSSRVASFLRLARELEEMCGCSALDIEFAMNNSGQLYLLQVRRITLARNWHPVTERRAKRQLTFVEDFINNCSKARLGVLGDRTIMAIMPDWNPAEIIGTTPRPLAASLYEYLITKKIWCQARASMGYRHMGDLNLMAMINNHPYIDVRNSFNSFLPTGLPDSIGEKLVNAWLDRLEECPEMHDKVEFDIVPTCMDFSFDEEFKTRYPNILSDDELSIYRQELVRITRDGLDFYNNGTLSRALSAASKLNDLNLPNIGNEDAYSYLNRADFLLSQCRQLGTLSFAIVARHAFIAEAILRSSVKRGALSESRITEFKRSIRTVTGDMVNEFSQVCQGQMKQSDFLNKYGHLRPGTYEITSLRYDERDDLFMGDMIRAPSLEISQFSLTDQELISINALLVEAGLDILTADNLLEYARQAIIGREHVKFVFTRILSDALSMIVQWGEYYGLSRDDLSYLDWHTISKCLNHPVMDDMDRHYLDVAEKARRSMVASNGFRLGHIIFGVRDIYVATLNRSVPNYVGTGSATGPVVRLAADTPTSIDIKNKIVCIENADPGFDWIFTKSPNALITRYGGANSHMAVRCAEFGLPAAIGCGDQVFQRVISAGSVELNCAANILRPLYGE